MRAKPTGERPPEAPVAGAERFLSQAESEALCERIRGFARRPTRVLPEITSWWSGELRWGRNQVTLASDRRDTHVLLRPRLHWSESNIEKGLKTNQLDDASLRALVRTVEDNIQGKRGGERGGSAAGAAADTLAYEPPRPALPQPQPTIWSEATYNLTAEARGEIARALVAEAEARGLLSAGYIEVRAGSRFWVANGERQYARFTQAQCSLTVRDPQGTGSGWAGVSSYDWGKVDAAALAKRALEKCVASRDPVALEPGRYTVILEPQAVADMLEPLVYTFSRGQAENDRPVSPFWLGPGFSKLGLKVIDPRLTLGHDPMDPDLGVVPEPGMAPINWIERGVLTNLEHDRAYSLGMLHENLPYRSPELGYRLSGSGPTTTLEEMIATTTRGLLVTRLSGLRKLATVSVLLSGLTRDGLWLIENGKITKPVKNFRFTESPLIALNQVEQIGVPVPVFRPMRDTDQYTSPWIPITKRLYQWRPQPALMPAAVPALKVRDFNFFAMADAV